VLVRTKVFTTFQFLNQAFCVTAFGIRPYMTITVSGHAIVFD